MSQFLEILQPGQTVLGMAHRSVGGEDWDFLRASNVECVVVGVIDTMILTSARVKELQTKDPDDVQTTVFQRALDRSSHSTSLIGRTIVSSERATSGIEAG